MVLYHAKELPDFANAINSPGLKKYQNASKETRDIVCLLYTSPQMGMYVSQDPIGLAGGILNLYGYVDDTNAWSDILGLISNIRCV